jgi:hypothetical protein
MVIVRLEGVGTRYGSGRWVLSGIDLGIDGGADGGARCCWPRRWR